MKNGETRIIENIDYFSLIIYNGDERKVKEMCSQSELNQILDVFVAKAKARFCNSLKNVILFGSYARGDFDAELDVDIVMLFNIPRENE